MNFLANFVPVDWFERVLLFDKTISGFPGFFDPFLDLSFPFDSLLVKLFAPFNRYAIKSPPSKLPRSRSHLFQSLRIFRLNPALQICDIEPFIDTAGAVVLFPVLGGQLP